MKKHRGVKKLPIFNGIKIPHLLNIFWVYFEKQGNKGKFNVQDKNYKRKCPKISFDYLLNTFS